MPQISRMVIPVRRFGGIVRVGEPVENAARRMRRGIEVDVRDGTMQSTTNLCSGGGDLARRNHPGAEMVGPDASTQPGDLPFPEKVAIAGVPISLTSYSEVLEIIGTPPADRALAIAVCNVHSVMSARRDPQLHSAIRRADVATTDGMPLVWLLRLTCQPRQQRVYGPELMKRALQHGVKRSWRHFLYGTTPATLDRLRSRIHRFAPGAVVVGQIAPPFRDLTKAETDAVVAEVRASAPDIVWVGLGMPRQEKWMQQLAPRLPGMSLVGVGAAFDLLSGTVRQAPPVLQRAGLEWAFRLALEPRRLWRRYALNNPLYLMLAADQLCRYRLGRRASGVGPSSATVAEPSLHGVTFGSTSNRRLAGGGDG